MNITVPGTDNEQLLIKESLKHSDMLRLSKTFISLLQSNNTQRKQRVLKYLESCSFVR